jgi:curli biogenesis system outer membrane secretion channel CsgG
MKKLQLIFIFICTFSFISCANQNIDLSTYKTTSSSKVAILDKCRKYYDKEKVSVAVVNFTNNSNFSQGNINNQNSNTSAGIGVSIIGVGMGAKSYKSKTVRTVNPKLREAFIPLIENMLLNTKSVKLITRSDLPKVNNELKLQDSGLLDPKSIVEFGKTSGVKYLVTGSIDYVNHSFKNYTQYTSKIYNATKYSNDSDIKLASAGLHLATSFLNGTKINTAITIKIIDVATSNIIFSEQIKSKTKLNTKNKPSYDELVGSVKHTISESLPKLKNKLLEQFSYYGYINQIKQNENNTIVKINFGTDDNVKENDIFILHKMEVFKDPLTNKTKCDISKTAIELEASEHITKNYTWAKIDNENTDKIKLLQLIKKLN